LTIIACRAKYPIAISSKLLDIFGPSFCVGYDIGCQFRETICRTSLDGLADEKSLNFIVPGFHGYGHNHLCQLSFLPLYVKEWGLRISKAVSMHFQDLIKLQKSLSMHPNFTDNRLLSITFNNGTMTNTLNYVSQLILI
jgi:Kyakuja-Dileera-Zisupton transposase